MILYAHVTGKAHPIHAAIHIQAEDAKLTSLCAGPFTDGEEELELRESKLRYDFKECSELVCDVILNPGEFYAYRVRLPYRQNAGWH